MNPKQRTEAEKQQYLKDWRKRNKLHIQEYNKNYYDNYVKKGNKK